MRSWRYDEESDLATADSNPYFQKVQEYVRTHLAYADLINCGSIGIVGIVGIVVVS